MGLIRKAVFLDRDGTINRDSHNYIKSREEFEFLPASLDAIRNLTRNGFVNFVITNQSAVPRNLISTDELESVHNIMIETVLRNGGEIREVFYCPHMPADGCDCRKPEPGLIYRARDKYDIELSQAVMVGDSPKDIECARRAGCGWAILVKSGINEGAEAELKARQLHADYVAKDLYEAAEWIIKKHNPEEEG